MLTGETLFISVNSNDLLAGETLFYKVNCFAPNSKTPSTLSKIAYLELVSADLKTVANQKIRLDNSVGSGDIFLPASTPSGNYKLIGYTKMMIDASAKNFAVTELTIINPFEKFDGKIDSTAAKLPSAVSSKFAATLDKTQYSTREKVILTINPGNLRGHYLVSVNKSSEFNRSRRNIQKVAISETSNPFFEIRGELVTGRISTKNKSLFNKNIALSLPGKNFSFKIVQTDREGKFAFVLDREPNHSHAVIQVMERDRGDYTIVIDEPKHPDYSALVFEELRLDRAALPAIAERTVALQIENAYFEQKKDSILPQTIPAPFYHPIEKTYVLDDFNRFPTLRETIIEVVKEMYFTTKRKKHSIHLRNTTMDNEIFGPPLVIIDGLLVQDHDELFNFSAKHIEKIDLINEPYLYGPKTFSGLASFTTIFEDFKSSASGNYIRELTLERPQPNKIYFQPDHSKSQSRIPDYRHQLLWLPEISGETQNISFYTSDVKGIFEIEIQGFTETGTQVSWSGSFEVK